jgi:hypothetical protein
MNSPVARKQVALALVLAFAAVSCTTVKYLYDGKQYASAAEALAAQEKADQALVAQITPAAQPVKGSLAVLAPTDACIAANWVTRKGNVGEEQVNYVAQTHKNGILGRVAAIKKRGLFETVTFRQCADPEREPFGEDYALVLSASAKPEWALKPKSPGAGNPVPIEAPASSLSPLQRIVFWLDGIEAAAKKAKS